MRSGQEYLNYISDFWGRVFTDSETLPGLIGLKAASLFRAFLQASQITDGRFVGDLPLLREDFWHFITVKMGERDPADTETYSYFLQLPYAQVPFLWNAIYDPTLRLHQGVDYTLEAVTATAGDGGNLCRITFPLDPFENADVLKREVAGDLEALFIAPKVLTDEDDLFQLWGHLVEIQRPSSEDYRRLLEAIFFIYATGPILPYLNAGLSLALGYPYSRVDDQVLTLTDDPTTNTYTLTTLAGYEYEIPHNDDYSLPTLKFGPGDRMSQFDTLISDIRIVDYKSEPKWWFGGVANLTPSGQPIDLNKVVVRQLPPEMAPDMEWGDRADLPLIGLLFEEYFKFHTFGVIGNPMLLSLTGFNAAAEFFRVIQQVKASYTAPYTNFFFSVTDTVPAFIDGLETASSGASLALEIGLDKTEDGDYAEHWHHGGRLVLNSVPKLSFSRPDWEARDGSVWDVPGMDVGFDPAETILLSGGPLIMGGGRSLGGVVIGAFPNGFLIEKVMPYANIELSHDIAYQEAFALDNTITLTEFWGQKVRLLGGVAVGADGPTLAELCQTCYDVVLIDAVMENPVPVLGGIDPSEIEEP